MLLQPFLLSDGEKMKTKLEQVHPREIMRTLGVIGDKFVPPTPPSSVTIVMMLVTTTIKTSRTAEAQNNVRRIGACFPTPSPALTEISGAGGMGFRDSCSGWGEAAAARSAQLRQSWERRGRGEESGVAQAARQQKRILRVNYKTRRDYTALSLGKHNGLHTHARTHLHTATYPECAHRHIPGDGKASALTGVCCPPYRLHPNTGQ